VFTQPEKARLVGKLKSARDRKRFTGAKVERRKSYAEIDAKDHGGAMIRAGQEAAPQVPERRSAVLAGGIR
jgi:hypothetical protein